MKVKLEDIIEAMEFANMETEYYYDTHNEKVMMIFDGMVDGEDKEISESWLTMAKPKARCTK